MKSSLLEVLITAKRYKIERQGSEWVRYITFLFSSPDLEWINDPDNECVFTTAGGGIHTPLRSTPARLRVNSSRTVHSYIYCSPLIVKPST